MHNVFALSSPKYGWGRQHHLHHEQGEWNANCLYRKGQLFSGRHAYNIQMCYSARVKQNFDHLSRRYGAEVDWEAFEDVFKRRAEGEDMKVSRDLQRNYQHPSTEVQKRTAGYIAQYLKAKKAEWENEIFVQRRRLAAAEESLQRRETKKAREDLRIGTKKFRRFLTGSPICAARSPTTRMRVSSP